MQVVVRCMSCDSTNTDEPNELMIVEWPEGSVPECPRCGELNLIPVVPCSVCGNYYINCCLEHGVCDDCTYEIQTPLRHDIPCMPMQQELEMDAVERYEDAAPQHPCDGPEGCCPHNARDMMDCRNYCGVGVDASEPDEVYGEDC